LIINLTNYSTGSFPHFFFPQKETWRKEKLAPDEDTVAKISLFAKIYTARLRLLAGATFQNFLTLITRFSPTYFIWCKGNAGCKYEPDLLYELYNFITL